MDEDSPIAQRAAEKVRRRRFIEDHAIELGAERVRLEEQLTNNTGDIIDRMRDAAEAGIPLDTYAKLVGVSRQTLYRWRDAAASQQSGGRPG
jgi:hypothetical protein